MNVRKRALATALGLLLLPAGALAERCTITIANGTSDELIAVTMRAEFAAPGSEVDRNLPVALPRKLFKNDTAKVEWECPTSNISYVATGLFANGIRRASAPFKPRPLLSGALDTAWIQ
jgi:hypothetical protein